jgi:hypothetical protein
MFSRYNVTGEEDLRDAMQRVPQYNQAESQRLVSIGLKGFPVVPGRPFFR